MPRPSKDKRLVWVPSDLVARLSRVASEEGRTFSDFTVEALEQVVKVNEMGKPLREAVDLLTLMETQRMARLTVAPREALNYLISKHYRAERDVLQRLWREAGVNYGKYLLAKIGEGDPLQYLVKLLLQDKRWEVDEVKLEGEGGFFKLTCISFTLPKEATELTSQFIEGVAESFGYKTRARMCTKGIITLELEGASSRCSGNI